MKKMSFISYLMLISFFLMFNLFLAHLKVEANAFSGKTISNSIGMKFVLIPAGSFIMGSPQHELGRSDDEMQHRVTLTKAFYLQTTEVTIGQWIMVMGSIGPYMGSAEGDCPANHVSWYDIQKFVRKLNQHEGKNKYRLPTEAEWEYACRAGKSSRFCFGNDESRIGEFAWYRDNSGVAVPATSEDDKNPVFARIQRYLRKGRRPHGIALKKPNAWGVYDMHGNEWEWVQDWYGEYPSDSDVDPIGPSSGSHRVIRGGCFDHRLDVLRCADRARGEPNIRNGKIGFRLLMIPPIKN